MKLKRKPKQKLNRRKVIRRLQVAFTSCIMVCLVVVCLWGLVAVDRNTRATGLSHAPALLEVAEGSPGQYRIELLGGKYILTIRLPWAGS